MWTATAQCLMIAAPAASPLVAAGVAYGTFAPTSRFWGPNICRGAAGHPPRIALTFDDGPTPGFTDAIIDTLDELKAPATFFVIGANASRHAELVGRAHAAGHLIGNHSTDHAHYGIMRAGRYWREQIRHTDELVEQITGLRPALFRPPMGMKTWHVARASARTGHTLVTWTRRAWDGVPTTSQKILQRLVPRTQAGDILMLHDGIEPHSGHSPTATVAALGSLIRGLRGRGLQIVHLSELIGVPAYAPRSI